MSSGNMFMTSHESDINFLQFVSCPNVEPNGCSNFSCLGIGFLRLSRHTDIETVP